ncbi:MAG TPA: hypothetical protein VEJ63_19905 [Planctomycetota bacterium]|nr:hypothetical protein [Planctomycetota bacterium]
MRVLGIICLHISAIIMASEVARGVGLLYRNGNKPGFIVFCVGVIASLVLVGALLGRKTSAAAFIMKTVLYTVLVGLLGWYLYIASLDKTMIGLQFNATIQLILMAVRGFLCLGAAPPEERSDANC